MLDPKFFLCNLGGGERGPIFSESDRNKKKCHNIFAQTITYKMVRAHSNVNYEH